MKDDWAKKFITYDGFDQRFIAWDETQANVIGIFCYYREAKEAVLEYAKTLNKKESKMDFQVGDKVVCLLNGEGVVARKRKSEIYVVVVEFYNGDSDSYTENGYLYEDDKYPCLFHEGTEINIKPAEPKRYPWVNIYLGGDDICGGATWNTKEDAIQHIRENNGKYIDTIQLKPKGEEK